MSKPTVKRVPISKFTIFPYEYLEKLPIIITKWGKDFAIIKSLTVKR
jgi:hypothetical protein